MTPPIWEPTPAGIETSNLKSFIQAINHQYSLSLSSYKDVYDWSIAEPSLFWESVWQFTKIKVQAPYSSVLDDVSKMPGAKWFAGSALNFAENLLRYQDDKVAIIYVSENKPAQTLTYSTLFESVTKFASYLRSVGVKKGDCVAGFMPNRPETIVGMLAATSIGAVWTSCSTDFGVSGVLDRFKQVDPKVLISVEETQFKGESIDLRQKLAQIITELPRLELLVLVGSNEENKNAYSTSFVNYEDIQNKEINSSIEFEALPFDHPLYIMFSSGTTGLPKSIVHGAGGTLLQHLKELSLHCDLKRDDVLFYYTTCGWMMWNWMVSALAIGSTIVLYDGSPFYASRDFFWKLVDELNITVFGTSAKFIEASERFKVKPKDVATLDSLRLILSTGSPLLVENFEYVYRDVKPSVQLASISGGTDIISCFALGCPILPVYKGELQCRGLGMKVESYLETGESVVNQKGELVCTQAFPSMPVGFWNDPDGLKYHEAYFSKYEGIWSHGDYVSINDRGGVQIFGRSDAVLNPGGVRIGTSEIYRALQTLDFVEDSLVVGQAWKKDERVILFVQLVDDQDLGVESIKKIKNVIRNRCSPRHVPNKVLKVSEIPYTINGKKVEVVVKRLLQGEEILNKDALANPGVLGEFLGRVELV